MTDRDLDRLAAADRRIARAEELIARLLKSLLTLDPASKAAAIGWRSLDLMHATLVQFHSTRGQFLRLLSDETFAPEVELPLLIDDPGEVGQTDVRLPPRLDW